MRRAVARQKRRFKKERLEFERQQKLPAEQREARNLEIRLAEYRKEEPKFKLLQKRLNSYCQRQGITGKLKGDILMLAFHPPEKEFVWLAISKTNPRRTFDIDTKRFHAVLELEMIGDKRAGLPILWSLGLNKGFSKGFIAALGNFKEKRAFPLLERMLKQPDRKVEEHERREALIALIKIDPKASVKPALRCLRKDADDNVRYIAAKFLGEMKVKQAVPLMLQIIRDSEHSMKFMNTAEACLESLGEIAPTLVSGKARQKVMASGEILSGTEPGIKGLIIYALAVNPKLRRHAPSTPGDARGRDYVFALRNDLMDSFGGVRSGKEIFDLLGLSRKKRQKGLN